MKKRPVILTLAFFLLLTGLILPRAHAAAATAAPGVASSGVRHGSSPPPRP